MTEEDFQSQPRNYRPRLSKVAIIGSPGFNFSHLLAEYNKRGIDGEVIRPGAFKNLANIAAGTRPDFDAVGVHVIDDKGHVYGTMKDGVFSPYDAKLFDGAGNPVSFDTLARIAAGTRPDFDAVGAVRRQISRIDPYDVTSAPIRFTFAAGPWKRLAIQRNKNINLLKRLYGRI